MPTLYLLGTGAALADPERTTTMLAFQDGDSLLVVDCGGDVVQRLLAAGLTLSQIDALVITHEHPDHVSGFPLLIEKLWLDGRERPLPVHGPQAAVNQARRLWEAFETGSWKQVPPIEWNVVPLEEGVELLRSDAWRVTASPGEHSVPVMGIRVESARGGGTVAYSADTGPRTRSAVWRAAPTFWCTRRAAPTRGTQPRRTRPASPARRRWGASSWCTFPQVRARGRFATRRSTSPPRSWGRTAPASISDAALHERPAA
jgi:glyoxylase-like metal-dependent hydrolase (beta-lactamase superfamily II)